MSRIEQTGGRMRDADLDRLLTDFFQEEMPAAFSEVPDIAAEAGRMDGSLAVEQPAAAVVPASRVQESSRRVPRRGASIVGVAAAAVVMTLGLLALRGPGERASSPVAPVVSGSAESAPEVAAGANDLDQKIVLPVEYEVVESLEPVERVSYATKNGQVEQETSIRWTEYSFFEQESGTRVKYAVPEVNIDVFVAAGG